MLVVRDVSGYLRVQGCLGLQDATPPGCSSCDSLHEPQHIFPHSSRIVVNLLYLVHLSCYPVRQCINSEAVGVTTLPASRNAYSQHGVSRATLNPKAKTLHCPHEPVPETVTALEVKSEVKEEAQADP